MSRNFIVLNEYEWAKRIVETNEIGEDIFKCLSVVARYYYDNGCKPSDIRAKLETYLSRSNANVSLFMWSDSIDRIVNNVSKHPLKRIDSITITKDELYLIELLKGVQIRRLAFTLLCISKFRDATNPQNNHWVNTSDSDILKMANVKTSVKAQSEMFARIRDAGLIDFSKKIDNINIRVLFATDGDTALTIKDFRNLGNQYMNYVGSGYFECEKCGVTFKCRSNGAGRKQKYCDSCAYQIKMEQSINSVMRRRKVQIG